MQETKRKILLLGGSSQQVVAIKAAKRLGHYTVLCDYLEDNPGRYVADKFYLVSTTDIEAVLQVAKQECIDGVLAYASDPAAPTAAYVAEEMELPGSPYQSVDILCNKEKFRQFLRNHGFNTPRAKGYNSIQMAYADIANGVFRLPVIVKPVDSSGSKGVNRIAQGEDAVAKLNHAMQHSRIKKVIVEEFVEQQGYQIAGDGFSVNGKLAFRYFGNDHFNTSCKHPYVPVAASFPCIFPEHVQDKVHDEIQRLIALLNMGTTAYNFDIRIGKDNKVYLMEVAPRNGGNYIPQIIKYATGVDLAELSIMAAMGEAVPELKLVSPNNYWAYYAVHSLRSGLLNSIEIGKSGEKHIVDRYIAKKTGEKVDPFTGANTALGILLMRFETQEQMIHMIENPNKWIAVDVR